MSAHFTTHVVVAASIGRVGLERVARVAVADDQCILVGLERDAEYLRAQGCEATIDRVAGVRMPRVYLRYSVGRRIRGSQLLAWDRSALALAPGAALVDIFDVAPMHATLASAAEREQFRREIGVRAHELLIGLLCTTPSRMDAFHAVSIVHFVRTLGIPARLLVHPDTDRLAHAREFFERLDDGAVLLESSIIEEPWRCSAILDAAMLDEDGTSAAGNALPALWTMAQGVQTLVHESIVVPECWRACAMRFGNDRPHAARVLRRAIEERDCRVAIERSKQCSGKI